MVFERSGYWASLIGVGGRDGGTVVAAVAEDCPEEHHVLAVLCEGRGRDPVGDAEFAMAELPDLLSLHGYGSELPERTVCAALADLDRRLRARESAAVLGIVHVGTKRMVVTMVGNVRAFLLAPGRADALGGARSVDSRLRALGARFSKEEPADVYVVDLTYRHPLLLLVTENVLGALEREGLTPAAFAKEGDTAAALCDRLGKTLRAVGVSNGGTLALQLAVNPAS